MNAGRLFARAAIGGLFVAHGTQKLAVEAGKRLAQEESSGSGRFAREEAPDAEAVSTSG